MRILITGVKGQLGTALNDTLADHELTGIDLPEVDITDRQAIVEAVRQVSADLVIHTAAYTDVEGCARNPDLAYRVNSLGTQNVALACRQVGAALVHISTNEVFGGKRRDGYEEWMPLDPINPYARSKAAAEGHVRALLTNAYVVRIAWAYAPGARNFVHAILRHARKHGHVRVVTDEIGNPTYMKDVARAIRQLITTEQYGTYHLVNHGACSRWAFANEILRLAGLDHVTNRPILSQDYPRASVPPPFAALHNVSAAALGITLRPWQEALAAFFAEVQP